MWTSSVYSHMLLLVSHFLECKLLFKTTKFITLFLLLPLQLISWLVSESSSTVEHKYLFQLQSLEDSSISYACLFVLLNLNSSLFACYSMRIGIFSVHDFVSNYACNYLQLDVLHIHFIGTRHFKLFAQSELPCFYSTHFTTLF